jgi:hypothetical protein
MSADCPQCFLPKDELAWQCDGCGYLFRRDLDRVRAEMQAKLDRARIAFVATVVVSAGVVAGLVALAMVGFVYLDVPLGLALVAGIGFASHRVGVLREHVRELERRRSR